MTINAGLLRLVLSSPEPVKVAGFYEDAFCYRKVLEANEWRCEAPGRSLWVRRGSANQLLESHFSFYESGGLAHYVAELEHRGVAHTYENDSLGCHVRVLDPDARSVCFFAGDQTVLAGHRGLEKPASARLQHYALRSPAPQKLVDFYAQDLGFTVSDLVRDDAGSLTAAFLRTGAEHHTLAIFRSTEPRFDHFSCETQDWTALRDWADYMASRSVTLAWGIGRHGPGNDTFFMVNDPDGNLAEISSDLEVCADDRPVGTWEHRMETLNQWGVAIMRS
jgi:catechol 2,3-dioxygenase